MAEGEAQQFVIKNGGGNRDDVRVRAPLSGTLLDLKKILQAEYPGSPLPAAQTVRAGGRWRLMCCATCLDLCIREATEQVTIACTSSCYSVNTKCCL